MKYNIDITELWSNKFNKIDTPDGTQEIVKIVQKPQKQCYALLFSNGDIIECAEDHLIESEHGWVDAKDLEQDLNIISRDGFVTLIEKLDIGVHDVYDLAIDHYNHRYWSENISSHNTGKSSLSNAIVKEIGGEALWINASLERGIDLLRDKIAKFASQNSFDDKIKIVVMDEFDNASREIFQPAFRGFIDEFSANCRFIITGNYPERIIEPVLNRFEVYDFNQFNRKEVIKPIFERLVYILNNEHVQYNNTDVAKIISAHYPSVRAMVASLQKFSTNGVLEIDESSLDTTSQLSNIFKIHNYFDLLTTVNSLNTPSSLYSYMYNNLDLFKSEVLQHVVITIAKYAEMDSHVRDKHLNLSACLSEIWQHRK